MTSRRHEPLTDPLPDGAFYAADPHPHYERLRREAPVAWNEPVGFWAVSAYPEVVEVLGDPATFSSARGILLQEIGVTYETPPTMMHTDPPDHTRHRQRVSPGFRPSRMRAIEESVRGLARGLVEKLPAAEPVDVVEALAVPFPVWVIARLLGVPEEDWSRFHLWSEAVVPGASDMGAEERAGHQAEMAAYLMDTAAQRRRRPRPDMVSELAVTHGLDDTELMMFLVQLLVAGNETTRNLISGGLVALADAPSEWERLVADRSLVPSAVEELLRWTSPVIAFMRTATAATHLRGVPMAAGDHLLVLYASANRDGEEFGPTAGRLDVGRSPNHHVAFGFGAHFCLGAALARLEARVVLEELLARFSRLERAGNVERTRSGVIAGITTAPLVLSP